MNRRLFVLAAMAMSFAALSAGAASADAGALIGLWKAKRWSRPPMHAALVIQRSGGAYTADLDGRVVPVDVDLVLYPPLKRFIARPRPCAAAGHLADALRPLDRHSFPSGHAMTAAAFGVPIAVAAPLPAALIVVAACTLMSWSRMALGHHYLSDVIAGTILGAVLAAAVALFVLP